MVSCELGSSIATPNIFAIASMRVSKPQPSISLRKRSRAVLSGGVPASRHTPPPSIAPIVAKAAIRSCSSFMLTNLEPRVENRAVNIASRDCPPVPRVAAPALRFSNVAVAKHPPWPKGKGKVEKEDILLADQLLDCSQIGHYMRS